jgi:A/G-specific adenine glycosylase
MKKHPIIPIVLSWYSAHFRKLPWRETKNPYYIWLSEIILQQTRIDQGLAYYHKFVDTFPRLEDLANAPLEEVLHCWQGLGYYSRARNLHQAAKQVLEKYAGKFPETYPEILALKGIGPYTAAAISSIAFGLPYAVVDGNVYRFLARLFDIGQPIDSTHGKHFFQELADSLLDREQPGMFNEAMMEMGATVCKPVRPNCTTCVVSEFCMARKAGTIEIRPVKTTKTAVRKRWFTYLILTDDQNRTVIRPRSGKDIWEGLFEFPLFESPHELSEQDLISIPEIKALLQTEESFLQSISAPVTHALSHQKLITRFIRMRVKTIPAELTQPSKIIVLDDWMNYPFPRLITRFLEGELADG